MALSLEFELVVAVLGLAVEVQGLPAAESVSDLVAVHLLVVQWASELVEGKTALAVLENSEQDEDTILEAHRMACQDIPDSLLEDQLDQVDLLGNQLVYHLERQNVEVGMEDIGKGKVVAVGSKEAEGRVEGNSAVKALRCVVAGSRSVKVRRYQQPNNL